MNKNYDYLTGDLLQARFPYMFNTKDNLGCSFHRGWMPILSGLCVEIEQLLGERREAFHWRQIKEKFGTGRFYYYLGNAQEKRLDMTNPAGRLSPSLDVAANVKEAVYNLVKQGEEETARSCMICGGQATPRLYSYHVMTLCADHHPDNICRPGEKPNEAVWRLV
ncbi:MAG: hypothetical protein Q8Q98_09685, partial [Polaromonas sp.]|nr:hypothetical protein [Polaromonas sp.]